MLSRKELFNLFFIIFLLTGIPFAVTLIKQQQVLNSRATINPIVFTGSNVKIITDTSGNSKLVAISKDIELNLTSTLSSTSNPSPSSTSDPNQPSAPTPTPTPQPNKNTSYNLGIFILKYFPLTLDRQNIDITITGDVGDSYNTIRQKTIDVTNNLLWVIPKATSYLGYNNLNPSPSLTYSVIDTKEYTQPTPIKARNDSIRYPDYNGIMTTHNICDYVENKGVSEVWIWAYQGPNKADGQPFLGIAESKMSSSFGDISNSYRYNDMPICSKTYTVLTFNYGRGTAEAFHSWGHQVEAELDSVDTNLFRSSFQGPNYPQTLNTTGRCGSVHNPPNSRNEYDYANLTPQNSDCLSWNANSVGNISSISCQNWGCEDSGDNNNPQLNYMIWMWQNLPGKNNNKLYNGKDLRNIWDIHGDFDNVMRNKTFLLN